MLHSRKECKIKLVLFDLLNTINFKPLSAESNFFSWLVLFYQKWGELINTSVLNCSLIEGRLTHSSLKYVCLMFEAMLAEILRERILWS